MRVLPTGRDHLVTSAILLANSEPGKAAMECLLHLVRDHVPELESDDYSAFRKLAAAAITGDTLMAASVIREVLPEKKSRSKK